MFFLSKLPKPLGMIQIIKHSLKIDFKIKICSMELNAFISISWMTFETNSEL